MQIRTNETNELEARCTRCRTWKRATLDNFYYSTQARRQLAAGVDVTLYSFMRNIARDGCRYGDTSAFRPQCRACESQRQRAARTAGPRRSADRAFGIEMELTGPSARVIIEALTDAGIAMDPGNLSTLRERPYEATNSASHVWTLKHDSSVRGMGLELVSPKLRGDAGFEELRKVCFTLQSVGATVDASCGLHVHVDFRNMDTAAIKRQALGVIRNQANIFRMVAPSRRSNGYCPEWRAEQIAEFERLDEARDMRGVYLGPRGVVNLGSYPRHGSVEFRAHSGSTNYAKISAYVKFLMKALSAELPETYATPLEMLQIVGIVGDDREQLLRFENAASLLEQAEYAGQAS